MARETAAVIGKLAGAVDDTVLLIVVAGLVTATVCGLFGWSEKLRKNEPVSTIGKSGDYKSPGGALETNERSRI